MRSNCREVDYRDCAAARCNLINYNGGGQTAAPRSLAYYGGGQVAQSTASRPQS